MIPSCVTGSSTTAERQHLAITVPHMLPSALSTASASAMGNFRGSIAHPTRSLCTLRDRRHRRSRNTRYQAGATPYLGRTSTGWITSASPDALTVYFVPVGFTPVTLAEPCADPLAASDRVSRVRGGRRAGARAPRSIPVTRAVVRSLASARSEPFVAGSRPTPRAAKYRYLVNCHRNPGNPENFPNAESFT